MGYDLNDFFKDVKSVGAPLLGEVVKKTGIGGPVGNIIVDALGLTKDEKSENELLTSIERVIREDPDAGVKLLQIEKEHKIRLQEILLEETKVHLADVQSARKRETDVVQATKSKDWFIYGLAAIFIAGFFIVLSILMFVKLQPDTTGTVQLLFGALSTGVGVILTYFFGSSKSSSDKTLLMHDKEKK